MNALYQQKRLKRMLRKLEELQREEVLLSSKIQELVRLKPNHLEETYYEWLDSKVKKVGDCRLNN